MFRSGSESPKFKLEIEAKPRRATVSGGSPTLERPALIIEDLDGEGNEASAFSSPESAEEDLRPSATYTRKWIFVMLSVLGFYYIYYKLWNIIRKCENKCVDLALHC